MKRLVPIVLLTLASLPVAFRTGQAALIEHEKIRVSERGPMGARREGEFEGLFGDTIGLIEASSGLHRRIPLSAIESIDRPRRTTTSIGRGAGRGFLLGVLVGTVVGALGYNDDIVVSDRTTSTVIGALGMGLTGALLGGTVGAMYGHDSWRRVPRSEWASAEPH